MEADPGGRPARSAGRQPTNSLWALGSLACSVCALCPIASLLGPLLGVWALVDLRRNPARKGRWMAVAAIVIGAASTAGWGAAARWWHVNVRMPMIRGPIDELGAGLSGDVAAFQAGFHGAGATADVAEARAFLAAVQGRYGRLLGSRQRDDGAAAGGNRVAAGQVEIPYTFQFENGPVDAQAQFILLADDAPGLVLRFGWLVLYDAELGDLVYPASAAVPAALGPDAAPERP